MKVGIRKNKLKKGFSYTVFIDYGIIDGHRKREPLETFNKKTIADEFKTKIQNDIDNNTFVYIPDITFSEAIDQWMDKYVKKQLEITTISGYNIINEKYLKPCLGHLPLKLFNNPTSIDIINNYYSYLRYELCKEKHKNGKPKRNLTYNTVEHHKAQISGILSYFMREGKLDRNICLCTIVPNDNKKTDIIVSNIELLENNTDIDLFEEENDLTTNQAITILKLCMNTDIMLPVSLAMFLGLRRSEVLAILKTKLNKEKRKIIIDAAKVRVDKEVIYKERTKNKTSNRILYIPKILLSIIEADENRQKINKRNLGDNYFDSKFLCVMDNGTPMNPDYLSRKFLSIINNYVKTQKEIDTKFKFPHVTYHTLRHLNINALLENGALLVDVQKNAGHADINTTISYTYKNEYGKKQIADKTDEIYSDLLNII